ncbi:MAG: glycerate kinase [Cyanothece sp. SIO2G6]|nr:glycerate kinase [Cyanothece sp. SIO2G6]
MNSWRQLVLDSQRYDQWCFPANADQSLIERSLHQRLSLFRASYPSLHQFCCYQLGWPTVPLEIAWRLWLPLAMVLNDEQKLLGRPLIQGVLGGQGTGKTTLGAVLSLILEQLGQRVCVFSIDDLYKTYGDRCALQKRDPRLIWRGPPGTHDVALGIDILRDFKSADPDTVLAVPRFDKSAYRGMGDRTTPEQMTGVTIVLFDGWFVGVRPVEPAVFDYAPDPIITDSDRAFARDCNQRLHPYLPLWDELDRLMVLYPTHYQLSQQWRREAEQMMKASGHDGMSDAEIEQFVTYFWRSLHPELFITPLLQDNKRVNLVVKIDANHCPTRIYHPK